MAGNLMEKSDWRMGKTLTECHIYMLTNHIACDINLLVGPEKERIPAHKNVLIARSSVFESMFTGSFSTSDELILFDTDPVIFKHILKYLYSDEIDMTSENVTSILKMANLYFLPSLVNLCLHYLESHLSADTACDVMELGHACGRTELWEKAVDYIETHSFGVLRLTSSVSSLCHKCLHYLISTAKIDAPENVVFDAAIKWAENECAKQGRDATPAALREILGDTFFHIRFPLMSPGFFINSVSRTGLLTEKERTAILEYILCPESNNSPFSGEARKGKIVVHRVWRYRTHGDVWKYDWSFDDAMAFKCDSNIQLLGFILYGPQTESKATYTVKGSVFDGCGKPLEASQFTTTVEADIDEVTYDVMFPDALNVDANTVYTVVVNISGPASFKGMNGATKIVVDDVTFVFSETNKSKNHTTTSSGQLPGLIFSKV